MWAGVIGDPLHRFGAPQNLEARREGTAQKPHAHSAVTTMRVKPMLNRDLSSTILVRILVRATVAGVLMAAVGVLLYKIFGLTALAAVLFAISCGVVRAAWPRK